jgi:hypothetical protein
MDVRFGDMAPDKADLLNGGLEDAVNTIPTLSGYGGFPEPAFETGSLSATCVGALSCRDLSGNSYRFAGTPERLYRLNAGVWDNVSRTASYTTGEELRWRYAVFGNKLMAVNGIDAMQTYTLGSSTQFLNMSTSASAPIATFLITVRDFVMAGAIGTATKNKVQWSRINNADRWTAEVRYQSDSQDLPGEGSQITGMTGGDFAAIFTQNSVWRASYVGSPIIFRFDEVAPGIGCGVSGSIARFQSASYFWSGDGFYVFDGAQAVPIGNERVDAFFKDDFAATYRYKVSSVIDPVNKLYVIAYPSVNNATGEVDRMLLINYSNGRWARVEQSIEFIYSGLSVGYTLDGLDALSGSVDALPFSLDSSAYQGGEKTMAGFAITNHRGVIFEGASKDIILITGESNIIPNKRAFIRAIRPLVQGDSGTTVSARLGTRNLLTDTLAWSSSSPINAFGTCPFRSNARFHRLEMTITGLPSSGGRAMGFDVDAVEHGGR